MVVGVVCCHWQESKGEKDGGRKVTFKQRLPARVSAVLDQMAELLHSAGYRDTDVDVGYAGLHIYDFFVRGGWNFVWRSMKSRDEIFF